jgi:hypothetical protein
MGTRRLDSDQAEGLRRQRELEALSIKDSKTLILGIFRLIQSPQSGFDARNRYLDTNRSFNIFRKAQTFLDMLKVILILMIETSN